MNNDHAASGRLNHLAQLIESVPREPGCYLWKDAAGKILYIGKAKDLRARMRQYIHGEDERPRIPVMMQEVASFDYIVVNTEHEALVLEMNLIQQYHPPYNIEMMDDKSYPYIALTLGDRYPALKYTREKHKPETLYFGPYTDARAARKAIDIVRKFCPLCVATCAEWKRLHRLIKAHPEETEALEAQMRQSGRPCFDAHVGRGPGVCVAAITPKDYAENVELAISFLKGDHKELLARLAERRDERSSALDFESAARYQKSIDTIKRLEGEQQVYLEHSASVDLIGVARDETLSAAFVFVVREGRAQRTFSRILKKGAEVEDSEILNYFIKDYYAKTADIPRVIEVSELPDDAEALVSWLTDGAGKKVSFHCPQRGERKKLLQMAQKNAHYALMRYELKTGYEDKRLNRALLELESALSLETAPLRIESFDISTLHGTHTVASMVVFTNGRPYNKQYRRFKIQQDLSEANDYLSMQEVLRRRYGKECLADKRFGEIPDLIIVDGGKPQLSAATKQLAELGLSIPVVGLAKADEELFLPEQDEPIVLPAGSSSLYLVKHIRDEAHRFAIAYHRELRTKAQSVSILDEISGVGPKTKRALMKRFDSIKKMKQASVEELAATPLVNKRTAQLIYATLKAFGEQQASKEGSKTVQLKKRQR